MSVFCKFVLLPNIASCRYDEFQKVIYGCIRIFISCAPIKTPVGMPQHFNSNKKTPVGMPQHFVFKIIEQSQHILLIFLNNS